MKARESICCQPCAAKMKSARVQALVAITAALLLAPLIAAEECALESDVIVYGATPGGFCAAIAAAREGASVILLEPTDHIGGVNTGGLWAVSNLNRNR
jgi:ribulose 1,5-bisphosphate synthetase/thiazole synthase